MIDNLQAEPHLLRAGTPFSFFGADEFVAPKREHREMLVGTLHHQLESLIEHVGGECHFGERILGCTVCETREANYWTRGGPGGNP